MDHGLDYMAYKDVIAGMSGLENPDNLRVGQVLVLPNPDAE